MPAVPISSETVKCPWCGSTVIVPESLRPRRNSFSESAPTPPETADPLRTLFIVLGTTIFIVLLALLLPWHPTTKNVRVVTPPIPGPSRVGPSYTPSPTPTGPIILLTFGESGTGPGLFQDAAEIALDAGGNIYVSDDTLRVQKFDAAGKFVDLWTINEKGAEKLHHGPEGLLADRAGNVYVILGGVVVKYKGENGERLGVAHGTDYIENAAVLADGSLMIVSSKGGDDELVHLGANGKDARRVHKFVSSVQGKEMTVEALRVAVDGLGNTFALYALGAVNGEHWYDSEDLAVFKFTPAGKYVSKFGSEGSAPGQFKMPNAIAIDNQSRVYVSDTFNGIEIFADDGRYLETIKPPHTVEGMAFDAENHLYIVGANKVSKLQLSK
ncbi:MAG TPA: NHL repeat-containing protein [Pyrinomonadaceae bacterium]|nr:NHL repeat-containing protein [Pyrinomonadaceae bacterium]